MAQKNETLPLVAALVITLSLLGGGLWWLAGRLNAPGLFDNRGESSGLSRSNLPPQLLEARFSLGDRLLFPPQTLPETQAQKQAAVEAIARQDFAAAIAQLEAALQLKRNDPEGRIYLNNARIGSANAFTIAVPVPISTDVNGSLEILRGVAQAQTEVNQAGGIQGLPLRVVIINDENDPAIAQQIAQSLVNNREVLGVVGHYASDVTLAAGPIYEAGKLVCISPVSSSVKLSGFGDYLFRTVPSDYVAGRALADYMLQTLKQQKAAVFFNSQSGYSQSIKSEFATALALGGGQVVAEFDLSNSAFSPADSIAQSTQQGATVLALMPNSGQLDRALQVVQLNRRQKQMLGGDDVYAPKTLEVGGADSQGLVVAVPWHLLAHLRSPFVQSSRQLWGGDVNWRTVTAYDATRALIAAIAQTPNRESMQQSLRSGGFSTSGATAEVRFLPSGDRNQAVQLVTVQSGSRSGFGVDFVPVP